MKTMKSKTGKMTRKAFSAITVLIGFLFFSIPTNAQSIVTNNFNELEQSQDDNMEYMDEIYEIVNKYPEFAFTYSIDENGEVQEVEITGIENELEEKKLHVALLNLASNQNKARHQNERIGVFYSVDQAPVLRDGKGKFRKTLQENLRYPQDAKDWGVDGMVYVQFVVDENGNIPFISTSEDIKTSRSDLIKEFEQDAVSAVKATSGEWKPAKVKGVSVATLMEVPIEFKYKKDPFLVASTD